MEGLDLNQQNLIDLNDIFRAFESFQRIIEKIHSTLDLNAIEKSARGLIKEIVRPSAYFFAVFDSNANKFIIAFQEGFSKEEAEFVIHAVFENKDSFEKKTNFCLDINSKDLNLKAVGVYHKKRLLGIFLSHSSLINSFGFKEFEFLKLLSISLLYASTNARIYEMTRKLAVWDNKTNLYNYRYFLNRLSNEIARARRYGRKLSLLAIDIDGFKKVNTEVGHLQADKILKDIAKLIRESIRASDIPSRFGGDEFFILLPETDIEGARILGTRLKNLIESQLFPLSSKKNRLKIQLTYGVAEYKEGMTAKQLMDFADRDLMQKKAERNLRQNAAN